MEGIDRHPARLVELSSPKRSMLDLDGERGGFLPARITLLPAALRVLAPPPRKGARREAVSPLG
jgi:diacylglycerol kinase family enzyme